MKVSSEQIMNMAATLLAGALSGDQSASTANSRLTITGPRYVKDAVNLAKMIAEEVAKE